ncbi:hypothetical protein ACPF7Z_00945 [Halomonas sp. GXIMD04776]
MEAPTITHPGRDRNAVQATAWILSLFGTAVGTGILYGFFG